MFPNETRVLVILPRDLVDRARVLAGRATTSLRMPVSLQIVLRALIEEGLRRPSEGGLLANVSRQAETVRRIRREARGRPAAPQSSRGPVPRARARSGA
jgi:phage tail tape-measure protein